MIKILFMDVDGTLTDGCINISENGEMYKSFNVKDGYGIHNILKGHNILSCIITGRKSVIVENRVKELQVDYLFQGISDKKKCISGFIEENKFSINEVAYIGDDLNDFECLKLVNRGGGITGCPSDAVSGILDECKYVCRLTGGNGAVREFIDYLVTL